MRVPFSKGENLLKSGAMAMGYIVMKKICSPKIKLHRYRGTIGPVCCRIQVKAAITGGIMTRPLPTCT